MNNSSIELVKSRFINEIATSYANGLDITNNESVLSFLQAVARSCFNFMLVNDNTNPGDRVPVNMKITEITDALSSDLIDYADFLDDFFRKAVE